ncbi:phage tail tube protein [Escherichia coli]|uniref:phage tail tube protein n=1 Tax=Escherichia coli TaxID=562 RepID=UPI002FCD17D9
MPVPTLWVYTGTGDAYANRLSDDDWQRLAKVKDLTPGEMTAESYDDNSWMMKTRTDRDRAGHDKSAGDTSFTLALETREGRPERAYRAGFESGDVRAYKIRFSNGTVMCFRGPGCQQYR